MNHCLRLVATLALQALLGAGCVRTALSAAPSAKKPDFGWSAFEQATDASFALKASVYALGNLGRVDVFDTRRYRLICRIAPPEDGTKEGEPWLMALSPNGKRLVMAWQHGAGLWDSRTGKPLARLPGWAGAPRGLAWSDDGRLIAAGGTSHTRIWNATTGKTVRAIPGGGDVAFSADGQLLAVAGDNSAYVYRVTDGRLVRAFKPKEGLFGPVAFSPDGRLLVTGGEDPKWEPGPLPKDEDGHEYAPSEAFYAHELKLHVWNVKTGRLVRLLPGGGNEDGVSSLRFTPDGKRVFIAVYWSADLYDTRTGHRVRTIQGGGPAALSGDGRLIAIGQSFYSAATGKRIATLTGTPLPVASLAFSKVGRMLLASDRKAVRLWNVSPAHFRFAWAPNMFGQDKPGVFFLPNGNAAVNALNTADIWSTTSGKVIVTRYGPLEDQGMGIGKERRWMALSPDGKTMVNAWGRPFPKALQIRDAATDLVRKTIPARSVQVFESAYSPDSRFFVAFTGRALAERGVTVFDLTTATVVSTLADAPSYTGHLVFSPDGRTIAGSGPAPIRMPGNVQLGDNRLILWDATTGALRANAITSRPVKAIAFSPDGTTLSTAEGPLIMLRDTATLEKRGEIPMAEADVSALAFAPDGNTLAAGDEAGRIRVVSVPDGAVRLVYIGVPSDTKAAPKGWVVRDEKSNWRSSTGTAMR